MPGTASLFCLLTSLPLWCRGLWSRLGRCRHGVLLVCLVVATAGHRAAAQADTAAAEPYTGRQRSLFSVGIGVQHGFIFAHSQDVQNTKGARPTGAELTLSWQRNDAPTWNLCNCFPRNGLLLAYYDYDNSILGRSLTAAYFLEPTYRISDKVFFSFRGSAGLSYLTNPYDSIRNPANRSYSTTISAYLLFGVGSWFRLSDRWWLNPSVSYQHISNGGMKQPNKGINWPTAGLAISYQKDSRPYYRGTRTREKFWTGYSPRWDLGVFGISRNGYDEHGNRKRFPVLGVAAQVGKQVGRISMVTLGAEAYRDGELRNKLRKDAIEASAVKAGIMAGHEFLLGKFLFSQRLGVYVFDQTPYFDRLYHRWGLHYRITRHFGAGFNLLAHRQTAEFIDLRLTYSIQKRYR